MAPFGSRRTLVGRSSYATTMSTWAGVASIDITPSWPVLQGGFGQRTIASVGVLDPVMAKALYVRSGRDAVLLITADLIAIPKQIAEPVVAAVTAALGLEARQICICASHTHSGPLPYGPAEVPGVAAYSAVLIDALTRVGCEAAEQIVESAIGSGVGTVDVFFNRRTRGNPNLVDSRVGVVVVTPIGGPDPLAVLFGVGCHPVTLGWDNLSISGDFPGVAQRAVEARLAGATALFFNSTEANVIPITSPDRDALDPRGYCGGDLRDAIAIGQAIAEEVCRVAATVETHPGADVGAERRDIVVQANNSAFDLDTAQRRLEAARSLLVSDLGEDFADRAGGHLWALASKHVVETDCSEADMRRTMIACCEYLGLSARVARGSALDPVTVPIQVLRIADVELLALPGEPLVEVGQEWTERTGSDRAFVVGLANAHHRYLPLLRHFEMADASVQYDTVTAGLEPTAVDRLLDEATSMLKRVRASCALPGDGLR